MNLSYQDVGGGNPILLIHAFPLSGKMWDHQKPALTTAGFRLIIPDLPGFGNSGDDLSGDSIDRMSEGVLEVLQKAQINKVMTVGLSLGGYVAFDLLRKAPELHAALVFCDTTFQADTDQKRDSRYQLIEKVEREGSAVLAEEMLVKLLAPKTFEEQPGTVEFIRRMILETAPAGAISALRAMAGRPDSADLLSRIAVPTLLIFGEEDKITDLVNARTMQQKIDGSELVVLENAGHLSNLESPDEFNRALIDFGSRVKFQ